MLRESERWVHVPPSGTLDEDADRLLVYLPGPRGTSRVWRSRPGSGGAEALILRTIEEARGAGASRIVWHTGDGVSSPSMDDLLPRHGFEKTKDLEVLAFEMGAKAEPELPMLRVRAGVGTRLVANEADLRRANAVEGDVFPLTVWSEPDARAYLRGLWRLDGRRGRLHPFLADVPLALRYLAFLPGNDKGEERAVATAGAEVAGETVRLWGAGTLAEPRGRGAYGALVMERSRHAHALGATLVLAKANASSSAPILRRAGFRLVARERRYASEITTPLVPDPDGRADTLDQHKPKFVLYAVTKEDSHFG